MAGTRKQKAATGGRELEPSPHPRLTRRPLETKLQVPRQKEQAWPGASGRCDLCRPQAAGPAGAGWGLGKAGPCRDPRTAQLLPPTWEPAGRRGPAELPGAAAATWALVGSRVGAGARGKRWQGEGEPAHEAHRRQREGGPEGASRLQPLGAQRERTVGLPAHLLAGHWPRSAAPLLSLGLARPSAVPGLREGSLANGERAGCRCWMPSPATRPAWPVELGGGVGGQGVYLSSLLNWGWASAISRLLLNTALLQQEQSEKTELLPRPLQEPGRPDLHAPELGAAHLAPGQGTQMPGDIGQESTRAVANPLLT